MTRAWKLRATGHTYLQIADIFAGNGLRNMSGEPWSQWQLASMLHPRRRSKYEQYFTDEHPDLIRARRSRPASLNDPSPEARFTQLTLRQKELITVLQRNHGRVPGAARRLGVTERNLYRRIELIRRDMGVANYAELIEARRRALEREKAKRWQAVRRAQLLARVDAGDPTAIAIRTKERNRLAALQVRRRADWQRKVGELATAKHDGPPSAV
jgi:hypothetical protein